MQGRPSSKRPVETGTQGKEDIDYQWLPEGAIPNPSKLTLTTVCYYGCDVWVDPPSCSNHGTVVSSLQGKVQEHRRETERAPRNRLGNNSFSFFEISYTTLYHSSNSVPLNRKVNLQFTSMAIWQSPSAHVHLPVVW